MKKKPSGGLSDRGAALLNLLFCLALCTRNPVFIICTYTVWALLLVHLAKRTASRGPRIVYVLLGLFAMAVVGVQTFFLFTAR